MPKAAIPKVTDTANSIISANEYSEVSQFIYTPPVGSGKNSSWGGNLVYISYPRPPYLKDKSGIS